MSILLSIAIAVYELMTVMKTFAYNSLSYGSVCNELHEKGVEPL